MAMLKKGFRFLPSDDILVQFLYEKIHHGHDYSHEFPLVEYDLYGPEEPCDVWEKFGGNSFNEGRNEDLYFFTKVKKMSVTDSRINRRVGSGGTWSAANSREFSTSHGALVIRARKTHLRYENEGSHYHGGWIMHEFCLGNIDDGGHFCRYDDPYVICRLSKKGRNQKKLGMKSERDRDHQPNVVTRKPRLVEHGCYEEGLFEYSRMGSTSTAQPQIDEVLEARNMSNNSWSEFMSSIHGINESSTSFSEDGVGINIENNDVVVEEHSNPCTSANSTTSAETPTVNSTLSEVAVGINDVVVEEHINSCTTATDEGVLANSTTSAETPMSFNYDDVFQFENLCAWEKSTNLDEGVSCIDADGVGINIETDHVVVEEQSNSCITVDQGQDMVWTNSTTSAQTPMNLDDNVFYGSNISAWFDQLFTEEAAGKCTNDVDESITTDVDAILKDLEQNPHVAVAGGNELTPIILD